MDLTSEAIKTVGNFYADQANKEQLKDTHNPIVALPSDFKVHDLESHMQFRTSFRGSMSTTIIADFAKYCKDNKQATCFLNEESMAVKAIFDIGTLEEPGHCVHNATLSLKRTPEYEALLKLAGEHVEQKELAEFMEDWRDLITTIGHDDNGEEKTIPVKHAINSVRKMTIESTQKVESNIQAQTQSAGVMANVNAKGDGNVPVFMEFTCAPYTGLSDRTFVLRLNPLTSRSSVQLSTHLIKAKQHDFEMAEEFSKNIKEALPDENFTLYIGSFNSNAKNY